MRNLVSSIHFCEKPAFINPFLRNFVLAIHFCKKPFPINIYQHIFVILKCILQLAIYYFFIYFFKHLFYGFLDIRKITRCSDNKMLYINQHGLSKHCTSILKSKCMQMVFIKTIPLSPSTTQWYMTFWTFGPSFNSPTRLGFCPITKTHNTVFGFANSYWFMIFQTWGQSISKILMLGIHQYLLQMYPWKINKWIWSLLFSLL